MGVEVEERVEAEGMAKVTEKGGGTGEAEGTGGEDREAKQDRLWREWGLLCERWSGWLRSEFYRKRALYKLGGLKASMEGDMECRGKASDEGGGYVVDGPRTGPRSL